jgi:hypothetical protein
MFIWPKIKSILYWVVPYGRFLQAGIVLKLFIHLLMLCDRQYVGDVICSFPFNAVNRCDEITVRYSLVRGSQILLNYWHFEEWCLLECYAVWLL